MRHVVEKPHFEDLMSNDDWLTAQFEANRSRLRAVAYRMLGSRTEADDAVQEAWLRLGRTDSGQIDNLEGWLTTVTARVCLDRLRSRRARREDAVGVRLPDQLADASDATDPAEHALMAESVGAALLVVLDSLAPAERVAFVLHDVFAVPFDEIGPVLARTPEAARQLASRARRRVQGSVPIVDVDLVRQREIVDAFLHAARVGDFDALMPLLDPDVVLQPDAAAQRMGSLRLTRGAAQVAAALSGGAQAARLAIVDGLAGLVWAPRGTTRGVIEFTLSNDKIVAIDVTGDADRVRALEIVTLDS
jgi:RNA polymerase sigma-70 factor (ECF subfamily)